jgi:hypothetical protein
VGVAGFDLGISSKRPIRFARKGAKGQSSPRRQEDFNIENIDGDSMASRRGRHGICNWISGARLANTIHRSTIHEYWQGRRGPGPANRATSRGFT